ncbi:MAG: D-alanyl-D-alanine carboxypeptidase [Sphingomonadales bacterium]|jgi:D-alanyl-D-alanine carboxypeptidase (penicillin-binding protein 5/6)|nr:D-alanyl-D-alanine carboxypeptidase [Sphingomonadales bacterium]MBK9003642.1 D-alanyl-D-alanine carboxypeptidase [Sphingomonadales bacterium]MBK9268816.1 D-alanyl-D-alanine carboxypeptidase [Sphingomonadales bacterium]
MRLLLPLLILFLAPPALAEAPAYKTSAPIAYVVDAHSGVVLLDKAGDKRIPTASMAKMMTAYVAFEAIKAGKIDRKQKFAMPPETWVRWNNRGSSMFLKSRQQASVEDLLHGIVTLSGNDASVVLAEGMSGSEKAFTEEMNAAADRLGMKDSRFGTANGWPDKGGTYSTAHDLGVLAKRIIEDHPELFGEFFNQRSFKWNNVTQPNRNPLLGAVEGADGMKTGHSSEAGYCLVGTAQRGPRRLIMVVAGLPTMQSRIDEARAMMRWGFDNWQEQPLFEPGQEVGKIPVQLGTDDAVSAISAHKVSMLAMKGGLATPRLTMRYTGPVKAPLRKGDPVGQLTVHYPDGLQQTFPLVAANDIEAAGFLERAWNGVMKLWGKAA